MEDTGAPLPPSLRVTPWSLSCAVRLTGVETERVERLACAHRALERWREVDQHRLERDGAHRCERLDEHERQHCGRRKQLAQVRVKRSSERREGGPHTSGTGRVPGCTTASVSSESRSAVSSGFATPPSVSFIDAGIESRSITAASSKRAMMSWPSISLSTSWATPGGGDAHGSFAYASETKPEKREKPSSCMVVDLSQCHAISSARSSVGRTSCRRSSQYAARQCVCCRCESSSSE
eukprot:4619922-Prymnesium_polylepis.1